MDYSIIHIEETDSTNRWLRESLATGKHGYSRMEEDRVNPCLSDAIPVVVADYQTAGRGCGSNSWESERGKNLTFSLMIHPEDIPANRQFLISQLVSVAICGTLERYLSGQHVAIKWPNDIYVGDRKICGMLIENCLQGSRIKDSIIGVGLNVNQQEFRSKAPNPVSLYQLTGQEIDRQKLLSELLAAIGDELQKVSHGDTGSLVARYKAQLYWRDGVHYFRETERKGEFMAAIVDVEDDGQLVLEREEYGGGLLQTRYGFKEVQFLIGE